MGGTMAKKRKTAVEKQIEDERKAVMRFVDQPGQWIDTTPPEVKARQAKALKELEQMMKADKKKKKK